MTSNLILLLCFVVVALAVRLGPSPAVRLPAPGEPGRGATPSGSEVRRVHRAVTSWIGPGGSPWRAPTARPANLLRPPRPFRVVAATEAASA